MLGRLRGLTAESKSELRKKIQVDVSRALFNSTAVSAATEGVAVSQSDTPALQKTSGKGGVRRHKKWRNKHNAGMGMGSRGSKESETAGRYVSTWPVVISNMPRTVVAADILHFLPPMGLGPQDIRPEYDADMRLVQFWVAMHTRENRKGTRRVSVGPGTTADMEMALNRRFASSSKGRYIMLTGLTMRATTDDVMRLFVNFDMLPASVSMLMTGLGKKHRRTQLTMNPNGQQVAVVRFETYEEANRAFRTCNFAFVRNNLIQLRIII